MPTDVMWFRRDLRLRDNPALVAAAEAGGVVPLFVIDPALWDPSGDTRRAYLARSLHALEERMGAPLLVRRGDPVHEVVAAAKAAGAERVHVAADYGPYGRARDERVE
ncbi:MAG TPA: deoxyribodipyrimidine photo-lyase, partial [Motilibacteraceae bacterium]|nr:deoxyribodipyrimidine photo-lyase [Motilibacteraceae bacterium]